MCRPPLARGHTPAVTLSLHIPPHNNRWKLRYDDTAVTAVIHKGRGPIVPVCMRLQQPERKAPQAPRAPLPASGVLRGSVQQAWPCSSTTK